MKGKNGHGAREKRYEAEIWQGQTGDISCIRPSSLNPLGSFNYLFFHKSGLSSCYAAQVGILAILLPQLPQCLGYRSNPASFSENLRW